MNITIVILPSSLPANVTLIVRGRPAVVSIDHDSLAISPIGKHASPSIWAWATALPCSLPSENVQSGIAPLTDGRPPLVIWRGVRCG